MRFLLAFSLLAFLAAPVAAPVWAQSAIDITGRVVHPRALSPAELHSLPPVTVELTQASDHGSRAARYTGALLWPVVSAAAPVDELGQKTSLQHVVLARGADGYAAALAVPELDPRFEGKQVLVGYERDGAKLPTPQLVVPGDARAGRGVHDLVAIEIR